MPNSSPRAMPVKRSPKGEKIVIDRLYDKYFQKSRSFLFPLLRIDSEQTFVPDGVYLSWKDVPLSPGEHTLLAVYTVAPGQLDAWHEFIDTVLETNTAFVEMYRLEDESWLVVFDLGDHKEDVALFKQGKYSRLSANCMAAICDYYGPHSPEYAYMHSYLKPDAYFGTYADLLDVPEDDLRKSGELCTIYDPEREELTLGWL